MSSFFAIITTLLIAIILSLLPMPDWTIWLRPAWVLMVLIYWAMITPYQVSVGTAWASGLVIDLLNGTLLGEHALAFTMVIYCVSKIHIRLRMYPMLQQGISIFFFTMIYLFILYCIQGFIGQLPASHLYWLPALTSMLLWPWLYVVMRDCRLWFKMS